MWWWYSNCPHVGVVQGEESLLSVCYNQIMYDHSPTVFQQKLSAADQGESLFVLNLLLNIFNRVTWLYIQCNGLAC